MGLMIVAFLWGFAEATLFFIIPDVILTFIAIHGFREGLDASLIALIGALLGGSFMYQYSKNNFTGAYRLVKSVPAVHHNMLDEVNEGLQTKGLIAMILGPIRGIPYKTYAMMAPHSRISFIAFFFASIPARFIRFFLTSALAWFLANVCFTSVPMWMKYVVWLIVWVVVYLIYFSVHPLKETKSK